MESLGIISCFLTLCCLICCIYCGPVIPEQTPESTISSSSLSNTEKSTKEQTTPIPITTTEQVKSSSPHSTKLFTTTLEPQNCNVDGCRLLPCANGGICHKTYGNNCQWYCECTRGWTGVHCDRANTRTLRKSVDPVNVIEQSKSPNRLLNMLFEKFI